MNGQQNFSACLGSGLNVRPLNTTQCSSSILLLACPRKGVSFVGGSVQEFRRGHDCAKNRLLRSPLSSNHLVFPDATACHSIGVCWVRTLTRTIMEVDGMASSSDDHVPNTKQNSTSISILGSVSLCIPTNSLRFLRTYSVQRRCRESRPTHWPPRERSKSEAHGGCGKPGRANSFADSGAVSMENNALTLGLTCF